MVVNPLHTDINDNATSLRKQLATNLFEILTKQKCDEIINLENYYKDKGSQDFTKIRRREKRIIQRVIREMIILIEDKIMKRMYRC